MASIVTLNGTQIFPTNIQHTMVKIGKVQIAANGARTFLHRATSGGAPIFKNEWSLTFDGLTEARRAALKTLALLTTTMTFVNELGVSYTVQIEEDAYSAGIARVSGATGLTLYYSVTLHLWEV